MYLEEQLFDARATLVEPRDHLLQGLGLTAGRSPLKILPRAISCRSPYLSSPPPLAYRILSLTLNQ